VKLKMEPSIKCVVIRINVTQSCGSPEVTSKSYNEII